jgi:hypothetical protein
MRQLRVVIACALMLAASCAWAQEQAAPEQAVPVQQQQQHVRSKRMHTLAGEQKKADHVPSIIQSELDRSRAEEKQNKVTAPAVVQPAAQAAPVQTPLWPILISVLVAGCATAAIVYFLLLRKKPSVEPERSLPATVADAAQTYIPAAAIAQPPTLIDVYEPDAPNEFPLSFQEDDLISSASPYASEDDTEMPEAALTMNLINKKRETKRELILEVMRRVQRKEKPQQIAEALRVGIGEVQLAMTLAKLKR